MLIQSVTDHLDFLHAQVGLSAIREAHSALRHSLWHLYEYCICYSASNNLGQVQKALEDTISSVESLRLVDISSP